MKDLLAQSLKIGDNPPIQGPLKGFGTNGDITVADVINRVVTNFLIPIAAVILFLVFIWGGFDFLMSQGSPDKVKSGRAKITAGIIGFILLIVAYLLVKALSFVFGLGNGIL